MHARRTPRAGLALPLPLLLAGCASLGVGESEYACSGMPEGVRCVSARQVYQATEHKDYLAPTDRRARRKEPPAAEAVGPEVATTVSPLPAVDGPIPIRHPAGVLRIRLNFWEDQAGDLHVPGYVYTEIEPRRWSVGAPAAVGPSVLRPPVRVPAAEGDSPRQETGGQAPRRRASLAKEVP